MSPQDLCDGICQFAAAARHYRSLVGWWEIEFPPRVCPGLSEWWQWWAVQMSLAERCLDWVAFSDELKGLAMGAERHTSGTNHDVFTEIVLDTRFALPGECGNKVATIPESVEIQIAREEDDRAFLDIKLLCNVFTPEVRVGRRLGEKHSTIVSLSEVCQSNRERLAASFECLSNHGFLVTGIDSDQIDGISSCGFSESANLR